MWTYERIAKAYCTGKEKTVGIGSGRTAAHLLDAVRPCLGPSTVVVGASAQTEALFKAHRMEYAHLHTVSEIDLYFDGADYADPAGWLIKGYGGALTLEKIAMSMSKKVVIAVQKHKCVDTLEKRAVPVEVAHAARSLAIEYLKAQGINHRQREDSQGKAYITDLGNTILDVEYAPLALEHLLHIPGVVAHGLVAPTEKTCVLVVEDDTPASPRIHL